VQLRVLIGALQDTPRQHKQSCTEAQYRKSFLCFLIPSRPQSLIYAPLRTNDALGMYQPEHYLDIPHTDLLSWTFGNTSYDQDKPVRRIASALAVVLAPNIRARSMSMRTTKPPEYLTDRQNPM